MAKFSFSTFLASSLLSVSYLTSAVHGQSKCDVDGAETIYDILCSGEAKYKTLCTAIQESDLSLALADSGLDATFWAPIEVSWTYLGEDKVNEILANKGALNDILRLHISGTGVGQVKSKDLTCNRDIKTSLGDETTRVKCRGAVTPSYFQIGVNGNLEGNLPKYIETDIKACNGIIHEVNMLIVPGVPNVNKNKKKKRKRKRKNKKQAAVPVEV